MNAILNTAISPFVLILRRSGLLTEDLDYHLVRASMVIMFFFFGYQKWWPYEASGGHMRRSGSYPSSATVR
jgi:uncharacterized membrane protein YkgB